MTILCSVVGISSCFTITAPQTEQWLPSVRPFSLQFASTAGSFTSVWEAVISSSKTSVPQATHSVWRCPGTVHVGSKSIIQSPARCFPAAIILVSRTDSQFLQRRFYVPSSLHVAGTETIHPPGTCSRTGIVSVLSFSPHSEQTNIFSPSARHVAQITVSHSSASLWI